MEIACPWCIVVSADATRCFPNSFQRSGRDPPTTGLLLPDALPEALFIVDMLRFRSDVTDWKAAFARPKSEARASGLSLDPGRQPKWMAEDGVPNTARERPDMNRLDSQAQSVVQRYSPLASTRFTSR